MKENDKIVFKYDGIELQYKVTQIDKRCWLSNSKLGNNIAIFNLLKIEDRFAFCEKEIGYPIISKTANFPEVNSLNDLEKIVDALYKRILELSKPKFNVGDIVIVVKREGDGSDYPYYYSNGMVSCENQLFTIEEVCQIPINKIRSEMQRSKYEEPFYYIIEGSSSYWSSAMLRKVGIIKDQPDVKILTDIGEIDLRIPSYIDTHSPAICDGVSSSTYSCLEKSEEPEYKLNFNVKPLKFLK